MKIHHVIYALVDPETGADRYVGCTAAPLRFRIEKHVSVARRVGRDVPSGPGEWCRIEGEVMTMKTTDWIATMPPKCREAFRVWAGDMWDRGGLHGLVLSEALWESAPGRIDGMDSADRLLKCMEAEVWIERGKLELTTAARRISAGNKGSNARPLDYFWMPRRTSIEFRAYLYPSPPEKPKGPMIQLPLFAEVTP